MNSAPRYPFRLACQAVCAAALLGSLSACGLKGPLYMPDPQADMIEVRRPGGTTKSNAEKKSSETRASEPATGASPPSKDKSDDE